MWMDMGNTYESIVLGTAANEGRVFTSEKKTFCQKKHKLASNFQKFHYQRVSSLEIVQELQFSLRQQCQPNCPRSLNGAQVSKMTKPCQEGSSGVYLFGCSTFQHLLFSRTAHSLVCREGGDGRLH